MKPMEVTKTVISPHRGTCKVLPKSTAPEKWNKFKVPYAPCFEMLKHQYILFKHHYTYYLNSLEPYN